MHPNLKEMRDAPRCGAKTRRGTPCAAPAVSGKRRCRMHGGAKGSGAPCGERHGHYKHGFWSKEAAAMRRLARELLAMS